MTVGSENATMSMLYTTENRGVQMSRITCPAVVSALSGVALCVATTSSPLHAESLVLEVQPGESWFGGITSGGSAMPWTTAPSSTAPAASRSRRRFLACRISCRWQNECGWHGRFGRICIIHHRNCLMMGNNFPLRRATARRFKFAASDIRLFGIERRKGNSREICL